VKLNFTIFGPTWENPWLPLENPRLDPTLDKNLSDAHSYYIYLHLYHSPALSSNIVSVKENLSVQWHRSFRLHHLIPTNKT